MLVISIETSSLTGGIAITGSGEILGEIIMSGTRTYSRRLMVSIVWLMEQMDISWQDIDLITVSLGPGSFTGLRIGLATVKGLAMAHNIPVMGIPTLDIMAENCSLEDSRLICPVIDARRMQVYTSLYQPSPSHGLRQILNYTAVSPEALPGILPTENDILFTGDGLATYGKHILKMFGTRAVFAPRRLWHPPPSLAGIMAEEKIKNGESAPADPASLIPLYCRLSEAEENKKRHG